MCVCVGLFFFFFFSSRAAAEAPTLVRVPATPDLRPHAVAVFGRAVGVGVGPGLDHVVGGVVSPLAVLSCGVVWCGVVWCGVVWCGVVWCRVVSCRVASCRVVSYGVMSCLVLSCLVLSCLVLSCLVLSCRVLSCLVLFCRVLSCLVFSLSCLVLFRLVLVWFVLYLSAPLVFFRVFSLTILVRSPFLSVSFCLVVALVFVPSSSSSFWSLSLVVSDLARLSMVSLGHVPGHGLGPPWSGAVTIEGTRGLFRTFFPSTMR
jgi:hypothetical protein